ncbi:MAG: sensor histidine kinase [Roseburia sp.]|nr:sensor histidine kinase [Roseburia sp.]
MTEMTEKALLLWFGIILAGQNTSVTAPVVALLLGIIAAALGSYVSENKYKCIYMAGFFVGCFLLPELCYFLPVVFYDCAMSRPMWLWYMQAPLLGVYFGTKGVMEPLMLALLAGLLMLAAALGRRSGQVGLLQREMIRLRDTSTELNLVLREKNKTLMEKQDYEIHLATLRERNRIAREIHDNVGHMLSRSILQVGALMTIHKEEPLCAQLKSVGDTLNQAMNSIRESVHDLHDDSVDLRSAITEATREMQERYELTIDYDMSGGVPGEVKYCFIAVVKEAMANIARHSDASRIKLILREQPAFYQLVVEDNGSVIRGDGSGVQKDMGWQENTAWREGSGGIGLSNMRERVEALHGSFRIHTEKGFVIFISVPKTQGGI